MTAGCSQTAESVSHPLWPQWQTTSAVSPVPEQYAPQ